MRLVESGIKSDISQMCGLTVCAHVQLWLVNIWCFSPKWFQFVCKYHISICVCALFLVSDEGVDNEPGEARKTAGAGPHRWQSELEGLTANVCSENLCLTAPDLCRHHRFMYHCCAPQGSARRKKKVVHRTATADDKKLQFSLKKLGVNNISGIEEVQRVLSVMPSNQWANGTFPPLTFMLLEKSWRCQIWPQTLHFTFSPFRRRWTCSRTRGRWSTLTTQRYRPPWRPTPSRSRGTLITSNSQRCSRESSTSWEPTVSPASGD